MQPMQPMQPHLGGIYKSFMSPLHKPETNASGGPLAFGETHEARRRVQLLWREGNPLFKGEAAVFFDSPSKGASVAISHSLTRRIPQTRNVHAKYITDLSSLSETNPILAFTAAIFFFSNAGVPPLAGFYGKLNIFLAAVEESMYFIALAGVLRSVMGAFYSIRLVKILYLHSMTKRTRIWYATMSKASSIVIAFTFSFTLLFFVYPSFLFEATHSAALSLCV